jgi:hypothetical protein
MFKFLSRRKWWQWKSFSVDITFKSSWFHFWIQKELLPIYHCREVDYEDFTIITVADLPALIEGAHVNVS